MVVTGVGPYIAHEIFLENTFCVILTFANLFNIILARPTWQLKTQAVSGEIFFSSLTIESKETSLGAFSSTIGILNFAHFLSHIHALIFIIKRSTFCHKLQYSEILDLIAL